MKRKIITIDEAQCNGCGACVTACAEGALAIVNGKAKLVKDQYCDGFGDCMGGCPTGALKIVEREADTYDVETTRRHVRQTGGEEAVRRMKQAGARHGCPGMAMRFKPDSPPAAPADSAGGPARVTPSELTHWPVQIHLVQPGAPFFKNRELLVLSTCSPIACADMHRRFMRGRAVVVGCPKLDRTEGYVEKLAAILSDPSIPRVLVARMEVPCCGGLPRIVRQAVEQTNRSDLAMTEITIGLNGDVLEEKTHD